MEAETYLSSGSGIRTAIERRSVGWERLGKLARIWMPGRLKGIQVGPEHGTPFLAATQVFDVRPIPRKWLAIAQTSDAQSRFVRPGMILVTCSGSVGRPTLAYAIHEGLLVSHDLLRVEALDARNLGWLYAYLSAPQTRAITVGAQYGHIIKHLEVEHLANLPVPEVGDATAADFGQRVARVIELRNSVSGLWEQADHRFAQSVGSIDVATSVHGFTVRADDISSGRRRFEASYYTPEAAAIAARFACWERLGDLTQRIWWMQRFRRQYGEAGIPYMSADELFTVNPLRSKRILIEPGDTDYTEYFVKAGWIVMSCSGQVYGMNGQATLVSESHENVFYSHDLIRIAPDTSKIRAGYLLMTLTHRTHGRPLLIRAAYGTSIPHLDPGDVADFPVVRLGTAAESKIADLVEKATEAHAEADLLERAIATDAGTNIEEFIQRR
ncbi:MAG: hypothetical protein WDA75_00130 [Candidatus Latescibacterota bacterium]|jgi:hypothetical protein